VSEVEAVGGHRHGPVPLPSVPAHSFATAARTFRALGDHERLRLLALLAEGERCVTELAESVGATLPTVSQRLRVLRTEGLVERRREGKHVYYSLADGHVAELVANALAHAGEARNGPVSLTPALASG
jgi:ArsR family transcriptional regulator